MIIMRRVAMFMPLLMQLADQGVRPVLVEMPGNLAVLDINAAEDVFGMYQEIEHWYIAGHSLGGAMASQYMEKNHDKVEGLILLGAYPVNNAPVDTLVIYGTHDLLLDLEQVAKADQVYEIKDGNHAYFGDYGEQEGDGKARISRQQQQEETVNRIMEFIENIS
jgi:pimeloyl-ACP methyl ester carboxylesterase